MENNSKVSKSTPILWICAWLATTVMVVMNLGFGANIPWLVVFLPPLVVLALTLIVLVVFVLIALLAAYVTSRNS